MSSNKLKLNMFIQWFKQNESISLVQIKKESFHLLYLCSIEIFLVELFSLLEFQFTLRFLCWNSQKCADSHNEKYYNKLSKMKFSSVRTECVRERECNTEYGSTNNAIAKDNVRKIAQWWPVNKHEVVWRCFCGLATWSVTKNEHWAHFHLDDNDSMAVVICSW